MKTSQDELLRIIYKNRDYVSAQNLIETDAAELTHSFLMDLLIRAEPSSELIGFLDFVLSTPTSIDYDAMDPISKETIFDRVLVREDPEMLLIFIKYHEACGIDILERKNDRVLQWSVLQERRDEISKQLFQSDQNEIEVRKRFITLGHMRDIIRDMTILEANHENNPYFLERLAEAKDDLILPLSDGRSHENLAKELKRTNLYPFYENLHDQILKQIDSLRTFSLYKNNSDKKISLKEQMIVENQDPMWNTASMRRSRSCP